MAETYCGKSCGSCVHKEKLNCPGCKTGPGARIIGDCRLAKCCTGKGHVTCESCNMKPRCGLYIGREHAPVHRQREREAEIKRQDEIRQRTKGLYKMFYLLFWLVIPGAIGAILSADFLANPYPVLGTVGICISSLSGLAYGFILLSQYNRQREYLIAGVLSVAASILNFISKYNAPVNGELNYTTVVSLTAGVIQLVSLYKEFTGHSEVMAGVDELADKWIKLWRWTMGIYCAMLGSVFVAIVSPLHGLLGALAGAIGLIVVDIVKLVYLYRSAEECKIYEDSFEEDEIM